MQAAVQATLHDFLAAFRQFELAAMMACWADDATAFLPVEHRRERLSGKAAIRAAFADVIARARAGGATRLRLDVKDMQTRMLGDIAIITLQLRGEEPPEPSGESLSRRTFVMRLSGGQWRIVHLHGSNAPPAVAV